MSSLGALSAARSGGSGRSNNGVQQLVDEILNGYLSGHMNVYPLLMIQKMVPKGLRSILNDPNALMFYKSDMKGTIVVSVPYGLAIKFDQSRSIPSWMIREFNVQQTLFKKKVPVPEPLSIRIHEVDGTKFAALTSRYEGLALLHKVHLNNSRCKSIWFKNILRAIVQLVNAGYTQNDPNHLNYVINDADEAFLMDFGFIVKHDGDRMKAFLQSTKGLKRYEGLCRLNISSTDFSQVERALLGRPQNNQSTSETGGGSAKYDDGQSDRDAMKQVQDNLIRTIKDNIPLKWSKNSCWMDTQLVAMLFDRTSPVFKFLANELASFFLVMEKYDALSVGTAKVKIMDHIAEINAHYFKNDVNPNQHFVENDIGATGTFETRITLGKLRPFIYGKEEHFRFVCHHPPFLIRQFDSLNAPPETFNMTFNGRKRLFRVKSVSGLRNGHWQTLVWMNGQYFKVNVLVGIDVIPYSFDEFVRQFGQCRVFYLADDQKNPHTLEDEEGGRLECDTAYKNFLIEILDGVAKNSDGAGARELLTLLQPVIDSIPLDGLFEATRKFVENTDKGQSLIIYLKDTNRFRQRTH